MRTDTDGANVRFPPPLIYLGGLALGFFAGRLFNSPGLGLQVEVRYFLGGLVTLVGLIVNFAGAGLFLRRRTAIIPFKPASCLVTSGIYRWTRNPMYLGMALIYAGIAILLNSLLALILLPLVLVIIQTQVIAREEAYLERTFGDEYLAYKHRVGRWL
jgi:protein-S-isoprenylcysteine O-methyltransferase Ste14